MSLGSRRRHLPVEQSPVGQLLIRRVNDSSAGRDRHLSGQEILSVRSPNSVGDYLRNDRTLLFRAPWFLRLKRSLGVCETILGSHAAVLDGHVEQQRIVKLFAEPKSVNIANSNAPIDIASPVHLN